jgi:transcriptional regulator with XRE-family HTH domain
MELKLRELRERRGLSVAQMIMRLGVDDSRYRKWESGSAQIPLKYACACADILRCSLDDMVGRIAPNARESLTGDEMTLIDGYRIADATQKRRMLSAAKLEIEMAEESAREKKEVI